MDWFSQNAPAIQAIASIAGILISAVLAGITYSYVRITRELAQSSAEQVRQMREAFELQRQEREASQAQLARTLQVLARRIRSSIEAATFSHAGLRALAQPTAAEVTDLETMSRGLGNKTILNAGNRAVIGLRHALSLVDRVKPIHPAMGWIPTNEEQVFWNEVVQTSISNLKQIENECEALLRMEPHV
jgi:hypothetical protein